MSANNRVLPIVLGALLLGGTVGALVMHRSASNTTNPVTQAASDGTATAPNVVDPALALKNQDTGDSAIAKTSPAQENNGALVRNARSTSEMVVADRRGTRYVRQRTVQTPSRAYYDYSQPRSRTFWQKHRDKLTVAMGTGGGAMLGGIIGGRKGAAIGALAGGGGSALYTYKVRKRQPRF